MATSAPWPASASAMARPRPRLPPVTRATLPVRSNIGSSYRCANCQIVAEARSGDCEDRPCPRDALELVGASLQEPEVRARHQVLHRARYQDLTWAGQRGDPGADGHRDSGDLAVV